MKVRKLTPLGMAIKKALIDRDLTQIELSKKLGISPKYLNLIIYGDRSGSKYVEVIVEYLNLDSSLINKKFAEY